MALLSQEPLGLAPNRDRHDVPPRRVLPLVVVVKTNIASRVKQTERRTNRNCDFINIVE